MTSDQRLNYQQPKTKAKKGLQLKSDIGVGLKSLLLCRKLR